VDKDGNILTYGYWEISTSYFFLIRLYAINKKAPKIHKNKI
jgi:hypothetical protein